MMNTPLLELRDVNMVFNKPGALIGHERKFHVLKNVNMTIHTGEILALVGESGCGKTTVGKIITGLLKPTSGQLLFEGKDISRQFGVDYNHYRNSVQFIQQDSYAALNPVRTIYQSMCAAVSSVKKHLTVEQKERIVSELLENVGLAPAEQFLYKYPHQMSGGQRQRVLMARALALNPKIIVADEPVSMIDVSLRISILNLMLRLNRERGISFVYITHDLATAKYIANEGRIHVMYLGEIMEKAKLNTLLTSPKHPYTQALVSAVPVPDPKIARTQRPIPIRNMELMSLEFRGEGCPFAGRCPYATEVCAAPVPYKQFQDGAEVKCVLDKTPFVLNYEIEI